jgi:hypothetical protein
MKRMVVMGAAAAALLAATGAAAQTAIQVGASVNGQLGPNDPKANDGTPYDLYVVRARAGDRVRITMTADAFDAYLAAGATAAPDCPAGCTTNDDGGGGTNAALTATIPQSGTLQIRANSVGADAAYRLSVAAAPAAVRAVARPLTLGAAQSGTLGPSSAKTDDDIPFDLFTYRGKPGQKVVIRVNSEAFDPYAGIGAYASGAWSETAGDDDGGSGTNARLRTEVPAGGELTIMARALAADAGGAYTIVVEEPRPQPPIRIQALNVGDSIRGALDRSDRYDEDEEISYDLYSIKGRPGQRVIVRMESADFDPILAWGVMEKDVFQQESRDDDGGGGTNARLVVTLDEDGVGVLKATALDGTLGAYTLSIVSAPR